MHREVLKVPDNMLVDHINHKGLDNRKANLREATHSENRYNRAKPSNPAQSKYKGVYWRKRNRKWQAQINFNKKRIYLGTFSDEIEAAKAYDRAARKYHGQFAYLNFPND